MRRRAFAILAAMSLLVCVAVVVVWIRSYRVGHVYGWAGRDDGRGTVTKYLVRSERGAVVAVRSQQEFREGIPTGYRWTLGFAGNEYPAPRQDAPYMTRSVWNRSGFLANTELDVTPGWTPPPGYVERQLNLGFPYWLPAVIAAALPAVWGARWRRRRRRASSGRCPWCNYDLRETPERCPECGGLQQRVTGS